MGQNWGVSNGAYLKRFDFNLRQGKPEMQRNM